MFLISSFFGLMWIGFERIKFCDVRSARTIEKEGTLKIQNTTRWTKWFFAIPTSRTDEGNSGRTGFTASASFVEHGGATRPLIIPFIDWHGPKEGCERVNAVTSNIIPASLPFHYFPRPFLDPECSLINETIRFLDDPIVLRSSPIYC